MKLKTLLSIASIYMLLVGLGFIFVPRVFGIGAVPIDPSPALMAYLRLFGSPLLGIAVLDWMGKERAAFKGTGCHHHWQHSGICGNSCTGCVGPVQWCKACIKSICRYSPGFHPCFYPGRSKEQVSQNQVIWKNMRPKEPKTVF